MFNVNNLIIEGIEVNLLQLENHYLLTFRTPDKVYHTSLKLMHGFNERVFNQSEIDVISKHVTSRSKFDENIKFRNIYELMTYLEKLL